MRIEAYSQMAQVYRTGKAASTRSTAAAAAASRDEVQISSLGFDYQIAKQAVAEAPDIRQDRVDELSARVKSGSYDVDAGDFAQKLLERYRQAAGI